MFTYKKLGLFFLSLLLTACNLPHAEANLPPAVPTRALSARPTSTPRQGHPEFKPGELVDYTAQSGDTLPGLAAHFITTVTEILRDNPQIPGDATTLPPGMVMKIRMPYAPAWGTQLQIMPDSLFVDGPNVNGFDTGEFVASQPGWLKDYSEFSGNANRSGAEIIDIVATNFSISPRALLVLLEYQAGALSRPSLPVGDYPLGYYDEAAKGLYRQLVHAANLLNAGYYGWRTGSLTQLVHPDYQRRTPGSLAERRHGGIPILLFQRCPGRVQACQRSGWPESRLPQVVWEATVDFPHIPANLQQPALSLPFPAGYAWSFTGGPHSAWGGAELRPWAAIDFAPPVPDCAESDVPAVAMADGVVARSEAGVVMLDLDGDGNERTGWDILYLHIAAHGEALLGQWLKKGQPVGFPSCEGGNASGTHVHIARKYNGEWMPVDGAIPFNLEGWIAHAGEAAYQGTLRRGDQTVTASPYGNAGSLIQAGE